MAGEKQVAWGVMGSAWINTLAVPGLLNAGNARLVAMSSRRPGVAEADRRLWGAERAYESYEALLADREIEAVYIPLPNHLHEEWTVKALRAGKHVLCEKPLALTLAEIDSIAAAAKSSGKRVMEAFMYRFAPRWRRAIELVRAGAIGEARLARVTMGFRQFYDSYNIRFDPAAGGGALWDMGCYAVNMSRLIFAAEPERASATQWMRPGETVDTTTSGLLDFGGGRTSIFSVSFDFINPLAQVEIVGTEGWISMQGTGMRGEPFTRLLRHRFGEEVFLAGVEPHIESFPQADMFAAEFRELSRAVIDGDEPLYGLADARANARAILRLEDGRVDWVGGKHRLSPGGLARAETLSQPGRRCEGGASDGREPTRPARRPRRSGKAQDQHGRRRQFRASAPRSRSARSRRCRERPGRRRKRPRPPGRRSRRSLGRSPRSPPSRGRGSRGRRRQARPRTPQRTRPTGSATPLPAQAGAARSSASLRAREAPASTPEPEGAHAARDDAAPTAARRRKPPRRRGRRQPPAPNVSSRIAFLTPPSGRRARRRLRHWGKLKSVRLS